MFALVNIFKFVEKYSSYTQFNFVKHVDGGISWGKCSVGKLVYIATTNFVDSWPDSSPHEDEDLYERVFSRKCS